MRITEEMRQRLLAYQKSEITEHRIYSTLAGTGGSGENCRVLGFTFGVKLMETSESDIRGGYERPWDVIPEADAITIAWHRRWSGRG